MEKKRVRRSRDLSISYERKKWLLWHYFQILKEFGEMADQLPKGYLYELAGERVFLSPRTAGRYISAMLKNPKARQEVEAMTNDGRYPGEHSQEQGTV